MLAGVCLRQLGMLAIALTKELHRAVHGSFTTAVVHTSAVHEDIISNASMLFGV